ncbi:MULTISPECIES: snapalysin family zinc-dependent metalloprotease [Streptomyces]|uniref:Extracellular small neutral protease n=1 Tax=Streptomyces tsukubensis (strain DSM 42081 / NBRC 108919 / NRRL 18488 / 9993) TaxID=1114943 RepID=I2NAP0_STRT9|nr:MULTISPECIES: snapalysin family zinc-dependent metalloprotease [Streptomyces]AZK97889.1 metalloprotease [Streptomyces tsukubensis]EIF94087.1 metalloprotease [Streptomyces tsukubensis NRRL18488]MYS67241.1 snapalysin family zinc-dependent metalloprotease [Streptomyces sp. SID5473]QKM66182.1 snapalysin family zinc-dependent metalloprotease [Streptomyces tsukubensis NRRL18488]TAI45480.1 snapalysin family zinc-dependent metalloprotease [Streptomyces tsukubensis]
MPYSIWLKAVSIAAAATLAAAPAANAASEPERAAGANAAAAVTLYYDDSRAGGWEVAIAAGVALWNANVDNVRLVEAAPGAPAEIQIVATSGWPQATLGPVRPGGRSRVELGSQAVAQGYDKIRIAAHEIGHNLGLPDTKPGPCSQLMSGSSPGTACRNAVPNAAEQARVESAYAPRTASRAPADGRIMVDAP